MADIETQLTTAHDRGLLIAIYNFIDDETFSVGYVMAQDATHVLLKVVDPNGSVNGIQIINKTFITKVLLRSDYLRSTEVWTQTAIAQGRDDPWQVTQWTDQLSINPDNLLTSALQTALRHKWVINLGTIRQLDDETAEDADFTGFLGDFVGDTLALNYLDPWNLADAWQIDMKLNEINYIRIGAGVCVNMQALFEAYTDERFSSR
ncbi:MAG TPA: hypothetical protein DCW31_04495 [Lactobacillus sp.]|nr:hypothetical protein [Lactobacillus sp.]